MFTINKSITPTADRTTELCHDEYAHIPGPDPFPPGSHNHTRMLAELDRLAAPRKEANPPGQTDFVPEPLSRDRKEETGRPPFGECPRATRRLIADEDSVMAVWLPCNARTCSYCREVVDERDLARVAHSLRDSDVIYMSTAPAHHWEKIRKRAQRAGAVAIKMATHAGHDRIVVISSEQVTTSGAPIEDFGEVVEAIRNRPAWAPGRAKTSGPGLVSVPEWNRILTEWEAKGSIKETPAETMAQEVTVELLTITAAALKIPYRIEGAGSVRLAARWEDPRMVALRAWSKDPDGSLSWASMLHDAETAQGVRPDEDVPLEVYDRQLPLEEIAV